MTREDCRALWQQRIADQQASGLSIVAWCFQQDIAEHQFYYWRKRLASPVPPSTAPQWLTVEPPSDTSVGLTLQVGPATITVTAGVDPALLATVVRVLATC